MTADAATITIIFNRDELVFPARAGQTLLDAAEEAGHDLPKTCRQGHCGACAAVLKSGQVAMEICTALSKRDREAGFILACQALALTDMVTISYDE